jgi:hypothetical protein
MKLPRRRFLHLAAGIAALPAVSRIASAQTYPSRPITIVVQAAAGGPLDVLARILSERMRLSLAQPLIIENGGRRGRQYWRRAFRHAPDQQYRLEIPHHVVRKSVNCRVHDVRAPHAHNERVTVGRRAGDP